ncbi:peptidoglycan-binding domain-containing protein [Streptomyces sp. NPDC046876]|uniref:peptidoglycan-binding domain-containing protein n=1 Tax=Streptomyces sp. NPDC046876 TaxID=3155616 RepID=UPI0033ED6F16
MRQSRRWTARLAVLAGAGLTAALVAVPAQAAGGIIQKGDSGAAVRCVQRGVNIVQSPDVAVDGQFGNNTLNAVARFQKAERITVDGKVGPVTGRHMLTEVQRIRTVDIRSGGDGRFYTNWLNDCTRYIPN